jgi:heme exporter protein D
MDLGPHAGFIWAAYLAVVLVIGCLIAWLVSDGRRLQSELDRIEAESGRKRGLR